MSAPLMSAHELGAALYVPSTNAGLEAIANGERWPDVATYIFCTEDAIHPDETELGFERIASLLGALDRDGPRRFVRARSPELLVRLMALPEIDRIDGFVLPKVDTRSLSAWADAARTGPGWLMPTLETREVFEQSRMTMLREMIEESGLRDRILCLRIGGNDLLSALATRRARGRTAYDGPLSWVIAQLGGVFLPRGHVLSAPVFESLDDPLTLMKEVALDLDHGLIGKTAIHPAQVTHIHSVYSVTNAELEEAHLIQRTDAPAVFQNRRSMCEPTTHRGWADAIVSRAAVFGVR